MASDAEKQAEEVEALSAIFGEDFAHFPDQGCCEVTLPCPSNASHEDSNNEAPHIRLRFYIPRDYPSSSPPTLEVRDAPWLPGLEVDRLCQLVDGEIEAKFAAAADEVQEREVVLFEVIGFIQEQDCVWRFAEAVMEEHKLASDQQRHQEEQGRAHRQHQEQHRKQQQEEQRRRGNLRGQAEHPDDQAAVALLAREQELGIRHGEPFTVRKSVFQAHLAPVKSVEGVKDVMETLLLNRKLQAATHNMMAYRISSTSITSTRTVIQDCDDDGESAAGGRLLHMLQIIGAEDVVVVVSRWFGGVLLGPERFRHINNTARSLLHECGYCSKE